MHVLDRLGVVSKNSKIVNGVAVDRVAINFLMVIKYAVTPEGPSTDNVTVRQDVSVDILASSFSNTLMSNAHPLSESTTYPVASLVKAESVSKE